MKKLGLIMSVAVHMFDRSRTECCTNIIGDYHLMLPESFPLNICTVKQYTESVTHNHIHSDVMNVFGMILDHCVVLICVNVMIAHLCQAQDSETYTSCKRDIQ